MAIVQGQWLFSYKCAKNAKTDRRQKLLEFLDCGLAMVAFILTLVNNVLLYI